MQGLGRAYLGELFDQIQRAIGSLTPPGEDLHRVRLIAKRLRYAMEVFADCYPAPFRDELYPRVAELQDVLGNICDAQNQLARMESLRQGLSALLSSGSCRWSATLEGFCEELKGTRLKSCDELEAWKARVERTGFAAQFRSLVTGATNKAPAAPPVPVAQAS
jgi:CHAD domain-containing protein